MILNHPEGLKQASCKQPPPFVTKQPKANSLPTQGSLRQLLRNFVAFRRFGVINSSLLFYPNYTTVFAFFTLKFFFTPSETFDMIFSDNLYDLGSWQPQKATLEIWVALLLQDH